MKRHALFVGVDQYADVSFRNLRHSVSDAAALAGAFGRHGYDTHVLTNPKADEVLEEVERRSAGLGPGDVFLFFFAGHGFTAQGGEHLLICANDRLPFLRCNRAGIPVDLLEELTNGRGFHRAFLLDACRTDVFAGMESRGAGTRDLALVSLPDAKANPGTCSVLRSCDRFCPALEFDDLGHGVFTHALLGAMDDGDALALPFGETFVACVRDRMGGILRAHGVPADQTPAFQTNGAPFPLFAPQPRTAFVPTTHVAPPAYVVCPVCGKKNLPEDTFKCRECGRDNLCLRHQDEETFLCGDCVAERSRREKEEAYYGAPCKAQEEAERKAREEAARKAEERARPAGTARTMTVAGISFSLRWIPSNGTRSGFWIGETSVTQALWKAVMGGNPSYFKGKNNPVASVSWNDCQTFLKKVNGLPEVVSSGLSYRLPSEEEWEFACRAGATGAYCKLADGTEIREATLVRVAWFNWNSGNRTHPVGQKEPNAWGLYDMHGNVWEWTSASYGEFCVIRGGGRGCSAGLCESSSRNGGSPSDRDDSLGFRLCASGRAD